MYSDDCEMTVGVMNALTKAVDVKEVSASEGPIVLVELNAAVKRQGKKGPS